MSDGQNYLQKIFHDAFRKTKALLNGEELPEETEQPKERAVSIDDVWWHAYMQALERDDWSSVINIYTDDGDSMYAVIASEGKLFRASIAVDDDTIILSDEWVPVVHKQQFEPVEEVEEEERMNKSIIRQMEDGRYRWLSVSCTAVLNRSGSIDSRKLFDSFIEKIENGEEEYPNRYFYHIVDDKFKTGECDFVARDGFLLITSGLYDPVDENPLAKAEVEARLKDPAKWGESIGFLAAEPEMFEVADGIKLPVYNDGILREISNLPEADAASWFTNFTNVQEVKRMLKDNEKKALIEMMGDEDAEQFLEETDSINRNIDDSEMIKRENENEELEAEEVEDEIQEEAESTTDEEPVEDTVEEIVSEVEDQEVIEDEVPGEEVEDEVFEMDDDLFNEISESVAEKIRSDVGDRIAELEGLVETLQEEIQNQNGIIENRLNSLEQVDDEKRQQWLHDLPRKKPRVISRRRTGETIVEEPEQVTTEEVAKGTLAKFPDGK